MRRLLAFCLIFAACSTATNDEILAAWVESAVAGDLASAQEVMIDGLSFPLGGSATSWIDGAAPFGSYEIVVECRPDGANSVCDATWRDSWIDNMGGIESGAMAIQGRVEDGVVVSISSVEFDADLRFALNEHAAWLQANRRADYDDLCLDDVFARTCSELLVDTVAEWQAASGE